MSAPTPAHVDSIDWACLEHARGSAQDIPAALATLCGDGPAVAVAALRTLYGTICHQGSVYSATVAAVPFLAAAATDPASDVRDGVVGLLAEIASAPFAFVTRADWYADRPAAINRGARYGMSVEPACRDAVLTAAPALVEALPAAPPAAQLWTVALVANLAELHRQLVPAVEDHSTALTEPWVATALELLRAATEPGPRPAGAAAALALATRGVPEAYEFDQEVVSDVLAAVVRQLSEPDGGIATARLLHRYADQLPRIVYAPSWRDLGPGC